MPVNKISDYEEYQYECPFWRSLECFVEDAYSQNRWFFEHCIMGKGECCVLFKSYITPEYQNFELQICVTEDCGEYKFRVIKHSCEIV